MSIACSRALVSLSLSLCVCVSSSSSSSWSLSLSSSRDALTTTRGGFFVFDGQMLVDDIGDVTITNDGATILSFWRWNIRRRRFSSNSRSCKIEVGDGTTSVVVLAAELLRGERFSDAENSSDLGRMGYRLAAKECVKYCEKHMSETSKS